MKRTTIMRVDKDFRELVIKISNAEGLTTSQYTKQLAKYIKK